MAQGPAEPAREARQDFHANVEWVLANLGCAPGDVLRDDLRHHAFGV